MALEYHPEGGRHSSKGPKKKKKKPHSLVPVWHKGNPPLNYTQTLSLPIALHIG